MRKRLRGLTGALAVPFRADPGRAWAVFVCFALRGLADVSLAYWLKVIVDAAAEADTAAAVGGAVALATTAGLGLLAGAAGVRQQFPLSERTGHYVDRRVVEASAGVAGLEIHERPEYVNQLELLRTQQRVLANAGPVAAAALGILIEVVGTMVLLASVNPVLLVVPLFALPSLWAGHRGEELHQQALDQSAEGIRRARHLFELATSSGAAKELRVFHLGDELVRRHREAWDAVDAALDRAAWRGMLRTAAGWTVFVLGYVGAVVVTVREAAAGRASVGDVVLVLTLLALITNQVMGATETVTTLARMSRVAGRYLWLLDAGRAARAGPSSPAPAPDRLTGGIRCRAVGFRYPGTEAEVLANIDLDIPAGTTVALVGENGAGKSTLVKLLCRFYEPTSGTIETEGVELADIEVERWREGMTAGFQDYARLELVARQSIGVGDVARVDDDIAVRAALGRAAASDVVDGLPAGLDTQLGRSFSAGAEPSGGQWQKLALGRAMMRRRPVLVVLDEPTAALDTDAEAALFRRYAATARALAAENGAITLLVSHRFSTVRMADLIVVMDGGRVVELGSHDQLMAAHGLYQELFDLQARPYR